MKMKRHFVQTAAQRWGRGERMIMESVRKMKVKEQEAFDIGYLNGYEQGRRDAVEAAPVVYGEWGEWEHGGGHYCTVCGKDSLCDGVE